jgi:NADH oxidase (H2O2-forming)
LYICSTPEEGKVLREAAKNAKRAVVIGGGAIGLELALSLKHLGLEVTATKRSPQPLPDELDPDMAELVTAFLKSQGIRNLFGKGIESINGSDCVKSVTIAGEVIPCEVVVMATGVDPTSALAKEAELKTEKGYILTDDHMRTSDHSIYAVGDNSISYSNIDGKPAVIALATTAYRQAATAGVNAAGGDAVYEGTLGTFVTYFGGLELSCTGYNTATAESHGFKVVSGRANMKTKPHWMPDSQDISVKIIAEAKTGRILGGQAIGTEGTDWRINIISLAIKKKMTVHELSKIELAYCPAVSDLYDPLLIAADITLRRIEAA